MLANLKKSSLAIFVRLLMKSCCRKNRLRIGDQDNGNLIRGLLQVVVIKLQFNPFAVQALFEAPAQLR